MLPLVSFIASPILLFSTLSYTYKMNHKAIKATGNKAMFLNLGVVILSVNQIWNVTNDSYNDMHEKGTFGSAASFATNVLIANVLTNYMANKVIQISDLNNAVSMMSKIKGSASFFLGFSIGANALIYCNQNIGNVIFDKNETYQEFVNKGKLQVTISLAVSTILSTISTKFFTKISNIESNIIKISSVAILAPIVLSSFHHDDYLKLCDGIKSTMSGLITGNYNNE